MDDEENIITRVSSTRVSPSPDRSTTMGAVSVPAASRGRFLKYVTSFVIYFSTFSYGVGFNFIAPTVIDFSRKFNTDVSHVSLVFSVLTGSYLVGALVSGILFNYINRQFLAILILSLIPLSLFLLPQVDEIQLFFILAGCIGFGGGGWDAVQIAWIIDIWRDEAAPFILTQHFSWSVGTIFPPLILAPYLNGTNDGPDNLPTTTSKIAAFVGASLGELELASDVTVSPNVIPNKTSKGNAELYIPFSIGGGLVALAVTMHVVLFFCTFNFKRLFRRRQIHDRVRVNSLAASNGDTERLLDSDNNETFVGADHPHDHDHDHEDHDQVILTPLQQEANQKGRRFLLIFLSCLCIASYSGLEMLTMQFLPTFAVYAQRSFTEAQGAQLLFSCTIAYCIGRGVGILLVLKIPPHFILCGNVILLFVSNVILFLFADNSVTLLWFGSVLIGAGMSTVYPSYYAFIEKYIFISNSVSTIVTISAGLVMAICPVIVGQSVEKNPSIMIYVNFVAIVVFVISFSITFWVTWVKNRREGSRNRIPHWNQSGSDGMGDTNKRD